MMQERPGLSASSQIRAKFLVEVHEPVHESMTIAGLLGAAVPIPPNVEPGGDGPTDEFLRGVVWNDDPEVLLFKDHRTDNYRLQTAWAWGAKYKLAENLGPSKKNLTGRSHFGDLQFLHAMAAKLDEEPKDTLAKVLLWAEVAYRLSIADGVSPTDRLDAIPVTSTVDNYSYQLSKFFDTTTEPTGSATIRTLLTRDTVYTNVDIRRRAIGSVLHLVQDSYARGHTRRTLLNPQDLTGGREEDQFKPGTWGRYGEVENFHYYGDQDKTLHAKYDVPPEGMVMRPTDVASFNPLVGARDSITATAELLTMWQNQMPWDAPSGPKEYLEETVFKLSPKASRADSEVLPPPRAQQ